MTVSADSVADGQDPDVVMIMAAYAAYTYADPAQALGAGHQAAPDESRDMPA